tara:strand:+ start:5254 stop:5607 length:354 start_codon:yes stop_codon:yes gene_type:complete
MDDISETVDAERPVSFRYVDRDGVVRDVQGKVGDTLMEVATRNRVAGIDGDCGGNCACGTCHVRIEVEQALMIAGPRRDETELLEFIGTPPDAGTRLGCQVLVTMDLEGATVTVVES